MILDTRLFHNAVGDVADADFTVNGKVSAVDRAVPDVMIAFTVPHKIAAVFPQNVPDLVLVFGHYAITAWALDAPIQAVPRHC